MIELEPENHRKWAFSKKPPCWYEPVSINPVNGLLQVKENRFWDRCGIADLGQCYPINCVFWPSDLLGCGSSSSSSSISSSISSSSSSSSTCSSRLLIMMSLLIMTTSRYWWNWIAFFHLVLNNMIDLYAYACRFDPTAKQSNVHLIYSCRFNLRIIQCTFNLLM